MPADWLHTLTVLQSDFKEPCKGKDQCDRESAGAKSVMSSFVNSGNNLMSATDMFNGLHYGKGIRNIQTCVLEIDLEKSSLEGSAIKDVSAYNSMHFMPDRMILRRNYCLSRSRVMRRI